MIQFFKNQFRKWVKNTYNKMYRNDICHKTPGVLIDELFTNDMKIWFLQEKIMAEGSAEDIANYSKECQKLNAKRNKLIRNIDEILDFSTDSVSMKTY